MLYLYKKDKIESLTLKVGKLPSSKAGRLKRTSIAQALGPAT